MAVIQDGGNTPGVVAVDVAGNMHVTLPPSTDPASAGVAMMFTQRDNGAIIGVQEINSPWTDDRARLQVAVDSMIDAEQFNYIAQNTGKFSYLNTTMTESWAINGTSSNGTGITTASTGLTGGTYQYYPVIGDTTTIVEIQASFTNIFPTNTTIDFGLFLRGAANPYLPTDGAYFRLTANGLMAILNYNGVETQSGIFPIAFGSATPWAPTPNVKHDFVMVVNQTDIDFLIDGQLYAIMGTQIGNGQPFASSSLPVSWRHAIGATPASSVISMQIANYNVKTAGYTVARSLGDMGQTINGSYQGLSGGTMGSLASYPNSTNPVAAVPTNTTAALGTGLGGQFWETFTLAVNTDGIIMSYQVPLGTSAGIRGRTLRLDGIYLTSYVQTALVGGPCITQYSLAFGHTAVSLATAEGPATKAPRRIPLPAITQAPTAAQAVSTMVAQPGGAYHYFDNPVYVAPGQFIAIVAKHIGTVGTAGTIAHTIALDYSWE
jgi:hypothetical protein